MRRSVTVLATATLLAACVLGCGEKTEKDKERHRDVRQLPFSDFDLRLGSARGDRSGLVIQMIPDDTLIFLYKGAERLEDINLTIQVWYSNGESPTYPYYLGLWGPNTEKSVRLTQRFQGKPQKVVLKGTARVEQETVRVGVRWLFEQD